jgi:hypothetical protein
MMLVIISSRAKTFKLEVGKETQDNCNDTNEVRIIRYLTVNKRLRDKMSSAATDTETRKFTKSTQNYPLLNR